MVIRGVKILKRLIYVKLKIIKHIMKKPVIMKIKKFVFWIQLDQI